MVVSMKVAKIGLTVIAAWAAFAAGPARAHADAERSGAAPLPIGLEGLEVEFERGHRRDRAMVHWPPHPDSDTVYRIQVVAETSPGASIAHVRLVRLPATVILDVDDVLQASRDVARIDDGDSPSTAPDFDGSYELSVQLQGGATFTQTFDAQGMNSATTPQITTPSDCEVVPSDQPMFAWTPSVPQGDASSGALETLNLDLIVHPPARDQWHSVLDVDLPIATTSFSVARAAPKHLEAGTYRDVVTQKYVKNVGSIQIARAAWNARAFVVGTGVDCD
jgi:hypothetical protein